MYLRIQLTDLTWQCSILYAKARVRPLKPITLPKMELLASLLCAHSLDLVRLSLLLPNIDYTCWTDSTTALGWVQADPTRFKTFVSNRISDIQGLASPSHWRHCPGVDMPADLLTRGLSGEELINSSTWLHGPSFLLQQALVPSVTSEAACEFDNLPDVKDQSRMLTTVTRAPLYNFERRSSFTSVIRIYGFILRFIRNRVRSSLPSFTGLLGFEELCAAKITMFRDLQNFHYGEEIRCLSAGKKLPKGSPLAKLTPFIDSDGLIRVRGRLQYSELSYDSSHPIILPKSHLSMLLVRHIHLKHKHAQVNMMLVKLRDYYWLFGARRIAKAVKHACIDCQKQDSSAMSQLEAPLPPLRVTRSPPFYVTGLDHGGPLFCVDRGNKKFYILLFTCAVTRGFFVCCRHASGYTPFYRSA